MNGLHEEETEKLRGILSSMGAKNIKLVCQANSDDEISFDYKETHIVLMAMENNNSTASILFEITNK